jgi:hypothetical protein
LKTGHCRKCVKYNHCIAPCKLVHAELDRIERGRRKGSIEIIYQHNMGKDQRRLFDQSIYGSEEGIPA